MVQYVSRRRKGRSACRKAQTRALAHCQSQSHVAKSSTDDTASGIDSERSYETADSEHINRLSNKDLLHVKRLHKNTLRRERRAKSKIVQLQDATDSAYAQLSLVSEERDNAERALEGVKRQDNSSINEISVLRQQIEHLKQQISQASETVVRSSLEIHKQSDIITSFAARNKEIYLTKEALRKKVERRDRKEGRSTIAPIPSEYHTHAYSLKDKGGAIRPEVRNILRELACKGVGTEHASDIISIIAEGLGITVVGSVSARSIAQIMLEGLVQARMQIASELDQANHFTICGNGTSIKNHQYEAKSMYIQPRTEPDVKEQQSIDVSQPVFRTLGVQKALNHTAQHQFNGWIRAIDACCKALTDSPTGQNIRINSKLVAPKLRGVLTDHAADQKRFQELMQQWKRITDRERRAVPVLENMSTEAQFSMLSKHLDDAAISISNWRELSADKQAALMHDAWLALALQIGEDEFLKHSPESQFEIDFFAWTGCCMHKELNAVKGGVAQMARTWEVQGLLPPIPLRNKFDAKKPAHSNAEDKATRGGIKLASLAGALFNNKDDKKGYQYTVDDFFKKVFGYSSRFPDISNTRYGSYCDAATELILHTEAYISLLEALRDSKGTPGFTNIESNIHSGLLDASTLTELAVLALYAQAIGRPYMRMVRSGSLNAMDLGPLHDRVKAHCRAIVCNPSLLLSPAALAATGTLDGENWDRPEVVYRVAYLGSSLPHLEPALVAFFEGALRTWV